LVDRTWKQAVEKIESAKPQELAGHDMACVRVTKPGGTRLFVVAAEQLKPLTRRAMKITRLREKREALRRRRQAPKRPEEKD
jgi:hypothetical protein